MLVRNLMTRILKSRGMKWNEIWKTENSENTPKISDFSQKNTILLTQRFKLRVEFMILYGATKQAICIVKAIYLFFNIIVRPKQ